MSTEENKVTSATEWEDIPAEKFQRLAIGQTRGEDLEKTRLRWLL